MTQGVKERTPGTMPNSEGRKSISPSEQGKIPEGSKISPETPRTYTDKELMDAVKAAEGRAAKELSTYKAQVEQLQTDLADNASEIEKLQAKFDDLAKDDPEKFDVAKELKAARDERKQLKADRRDLDTREATLADSKAEVEKWKRDQAVYTVADEYTTATGEAVNFDAFMTAADKLKLTDREGLVTLAETMGLKPKSEKSEASSVLPYSGNTKGGEPPSEEAKLRARYPSMYPK